MKASPRPSRKIEGNPGQKALDRHSCAAGMAGGADNLLSTRAEPPRLPTILHTGTPMQREPRPDTGVSNLGTSQTVSTEMQSVVLEITPVQAEELLKWNQGNRPINIGAVDRLAAAIQRGEWILTHQGIALAPDGMLLDGQHRLMAIAKAGVPCPMMVSFNVPKSAFMVTDTGVRRKTSHILQMSPEIVAAATCMWSIFHDSFHGQPTTTQIADILEWAGEPIRQTVEAAKERRVRLRSSAGIRAAVVCHVMAGNGDLVLPKYRAFVTADLQAEFPPSVEGFWHQIERGHTSARKNKWELAARAWRSFDPAGWKSTRIQIKDISVPLGEMTSHAQRYHQTKMRDKHQTKPTLPPGHVLSKTALTVASSQAGRQSMYVERLTSGIQPHK
jgi:hypothetical protein